MCFVDTGEVNFDNRTIWGIKHHWQSCVKLKDYSVAYFDHFAAFKVLYLWTSFKGGAHKCFENLLDIYVIAIKARSSILVQLIRYTLSKF